MHQTEKRPSRRDRRQIKDTVNLENNCHGFRFCTAGIFVLRKVVKPNQTLQPRRRCSPEPVQTQSELLASYQASPSFCLHAAASHASMPGIATHDNPLMERTSLTYAMKYAGIRRCEDIHGSSWKRPPAPQFFRTRRIRFHRSAWLVYDEEGRIYASAPTFSHHARQSVLREMSVLVFPSARVSGPADAQAPFFTSSFSQSWIRLS